MKQSKDYTIHALALVFGLAVLFNLPGCYNYDKPTAPKRYLLEMGYNTTVEYKGELGRTKGYTIDAIYLDGKDTVTVKGITQAQYDSLNIAE